MGVLVNLATSGVVGVTGLTTGVLSSANDTETIAVNTAYALTGTGGFTVNLPVPLVDEDLSGSVIHVKNLLNDVGMGQTNMVTFASGANNIDGETGFDPFTTTRLETFTLIYINEDIGWIVTT